MDPAIDRAVAGALAVSAEVRRKILAELRRLFRAHHGPAYALVGPFLLAARTVLRQYEPYLAQVASDGQLAAWLAGGRDILRALAPPGKPPRPPWKRAPADEPEWLRFPVIEAAARDLAGRELLTREAFDAADDEARGRGFTVASVAGLDALEKIRDALAEAILDGGTLRDFRESVDTALGKSALSEARVENVFRTNVLGAYARGQVAVLRQPLVRGAFTHVAWYAIRDSRCRPDHRAMETAGIDGTNLYRLDDPEIRRVWPPASWQCRCSVVLLTLEMAARKGLKDAIDWLRLGYPPEPAPFVPTVPLIQPAGWVSPWSGA